MSRTILLSAFALAVSASVAFLPLQADEKAKEKTPAASGSAVSETKLSEVQAKAIRFLKLSQASDGSWTSPTVPGITALTTHALLQSGVSEKDPAIRKALAFLLKLKQKNGGIYHPQTLHRNYETSITVLALSAANKDGKFDATIKKAEMFLRGLQWDDSENIKEDDTAFGGAGYGKHQRPDLSNTQFLIEALRAAGVKEDDPAMQKALKFVSRCQNLETEHNNTKFASKVEDGGFYYTPAAGGTSQAGLTANGGLRSYGSMTYAGLKSMIYAGLKPDDPRVKAAYTWIQKFYSVDTNPGLGRQGLFYYYHTMARTLSVIGKDTIVDGKGVTHDWRKELVDRLAATQRKNGSWINEADRWYEGDPNLVSAY
nr:terpene cyclase/mutase family protein [Planctomycetota bacterium]